MARKESNVPEIIKNQMLRDRKTMSLPQLSRIYGYSVTKIYNIVKDVEVESSRIATRTNLAIVADYNNGLSIKKISQKYDISLTQVYRALKSESVDISKKKTNMIKEDILSGEMTQSEIAKKYNCSRQYINKVKAKIEREGQDESGI